MTTAPTAPHEAGAKPKICLPRWTVPTIAVVLVFLAGGAGAAYAYAHSYEGRIPPNTFIGIVDVSGASAEAARERVNKRVDELLGQGVRAELSGKTEMIPLSSDTFEDTRFDVDAAVDEAFARGNGSNRALKTLAVLRAAVFPTVIPVTVQLSEERIAESVHAAFPEAETPVEDAAFVFKKASAGWTGRVKEEKPGTTTDLAPFFARLRQSLAQLEANTEPLKTRTVSPAVTQSVAQDALDEALAALRRAPLTLVFEEEEERRIWSLDDRELAKLLRPSTDPYPVTIDAEGLLEEIEPIAAEIERPPQDARFRVEDGRVLEFAQSETGLGIDHDALRASIVEALKEGRSEVTLALKVTEPEITTDKVNDLGVTEKLGTGTSDYKNSPGNRIRNIRNGVRLLNGILIPPGETFSLISALKPFTPANGYFPELVIKGDKIEAELGGGLCQIGTTTFRAAMNSGLPIVERRNHSLVVSYYNDPSNGNPGTDATIYEPYPDLKFLNDTGHYVLFSAEMPAGSTKLYFTFYGTSDGRKGSYSAPVVERWIPTGPKKEIPSADLKPGEFKCQASHIGADASFTYTIVRPNGELEQTLFTSHYRPLPEICLVGQAESAPPPPEDPEAPQGFSEFPE